MPATASIGMVSSLIQRLPGPLLAALNAWSYRRAQRRHQERMRRWEERMLGHAGATQRLK